LKSNYTFAFVSPWQKDLLRNATSTCLDATHSITSIANGILYTLVVRHPVTGTGCPATYMFANDDSMVPVRIVFDFIKKDIKVPKLQKLTIDISDAELKAIELVFPDVSVHWCLFHGTKNWMDKLRNTSNLEAPPETSKSTKQSSPD
jgi:hypothetical protein